MAYECTLVSDFVELLEFDNEVKSYETQPVKIEFQAGGIQKSYIPDVKVDYQSRKPESVIFEVKYRSDLAENWEDYRPKFKAAIKYARHRDMRFKLITEREIRTPYLDNVKFLLPYRRNDPVDQHEFLLLKRLKELRACNPESLLLAVFRDKWSRAELIPSLWRLVAMGTIEADLNIPLTMSTRLWSRQ